MRVCVCVSPPALYVAAESRQQQTAIVHGLERSSRIAERSRENAAE